MRGAKGQSKYEFDTLARGEKLELYDADFKDGTPMARRAQLVRNAARKFCVRNFPTRIYKVQRDTNHGVIIVRRVK